MFNSVRSFFKRSESAYQRQTWGELGYENYELRSALVPDVRTFIFPSGVGRGYADLQLDNGVEHLSSEFLTPYMTVKYGVPYYQARPIQNVDRRALTLQGYTVASTPGPIQIEQWKAQANAGKGDYTGGGIGSIIASLRERLEQRGY